MKFEKGKIFKNRVNDIVKILDSNSELVDAKFIVKNSLASKEFRGEKYNFWKASGSRTKRFLESPEELQKNKNYWEDWDLVEEVNPDEFPEYFI